MMSISAKELAKNLNISAATVSMVLNQKPGISESTRMKVLESAKKWGYDFSKIQMPTTGILYFVIYKKHGNVVGDTPFFNQVIEGLETKCRQANYRLQIFYLYEDLDIVKQLETLKNGGCNGMILLGTEMYLEDFKPFLNFSIPFVILDSYYDDLPCSTVLINNVRGSYLATSYLIQQGHQTIGYLRSSNMISNFEERADGYYKALRNGNIPKNGDYVFTLTPTVEGAYAQFCEILSKNPTLPSCFFADNDIIAASCMRALKKYRYKIPEDISIVGFDDMPICELLDPPLTTIKVDKQMLGAIAINQLLNLIDNPIQTPVKIEVSTELIIRKSVKKTT